MAIVATEIDVSGAPGKQRTVWFICTDHLGQKHLYGPTIAEPDYIPEDHVAMVEAKVAASLAENEYEQVTNG
jgi:hypothetical protein